MRVVRLGSRVAVVLAVVASVGCCGGGGSERPAAPPPAGPTFETYTVTTVSGGNSRLATTAATSSAACGYLGFVTSAGGVSVGPSCTNSCGCHLWLVSGIVAQWLKYPVTLNDTWSLPIISNGYPVTTTSLVTSSFVTVAAGTFTNVAVVRATLSAPAGYYAGSGGNVDDRHEQYWAQGVGLIKVVVTWHDGATSTMEL